eukprot:COSAG06_NODE_21_length_33796_cov_70.184853_10_plen_144_part_00
MMPQRYAAETKILAGHFVNHDENMEDNELAKDLELTETLWLGGGVRRALPRQTAAASAAANKQEQPWWCGWWTPAANIARRRFPPRSHVVADDDTAGCYELAANGGSVGRPPAAARIVCQQLGDCQIRARRSVRKDASSGHDV